ncbi:hypothetical protein [Pseudoduganella lutea]|uniref:O-antigen ligase domain-containing protein n=1 Tax=Pseudoduganella lutea TaxID=321985 RepID=A0A4P6KUL4_9BURK|nr:hypothetical protein [Pseudoduganella lutea]QBE62526.1 hypothetical protein EWM63_05685 [Pseudoduganella lutea]
MKYFGRKALASATGAVRVRRRWTGPGIGWLAGALVAAMAAVFMGMVTALGSMTLTVIVAGMLLAPPMLLLIDTRKLLPTLFVIVFLVQGSLQFFFGLRAATWLASGLIAMLLVRSVVEIFMSGPKSKAAIAGPPPYGIVLFAGLYLLVYLFSLALGDASTTQRISTLRFSIPIFGVLLAFYCFRWEDKQLQRLWLLLIAIAIVQLPLVTYQHFFMMATHGWDGVVGSFGHGLSPVLIVFVLAAMLYTLSRWTRNLIPGWQVAAAFIVGMAIILLGEVKIVLVWLPVGVAFVLRRKLLRNVLNLVAFICLASVFFVGTYAAYKVMYWGEVEKTGGTLSEKLDSVVGYAFDPDGVNDQTGEISRVASLALWARDPLTGGVERFIGYGPGSTSISATTGMGKIAARYRGLAVGSTAVSTLLWDVGLLGMSAFILMLGSGIVAGLRYTKVSQHQEASAIVDTSTAVLILLCSTLVYNRTVLDEPTSQLLCFFCLGCIGHYWRFDMPKWKAKPLYGPTPVPATSMQVAT